MVGLAVTGVSERIVLTHYTGTRRGYVCFGEGCSCSFWGCGSWGGDLDPLMT